MQCRTNADVVDNALWVGEPVKDIPCIHRDLAKPRNAAYKAGCRSEDPFKLSSRESLVYGKPNSYCMVLFDINLYNSSHSAYHAEAFPVRVTSAYLQRKERSFGG